MKIRRFSLIDRWKEGQQQKAEFWGLGGIAKKTPWLQTSQQKAEATATQQLTGKSFSWASVGKKKKEDKK